MSLKLKICGMRDNIGEISLLEPDYLGFIFYEPSPRYVGELSFDFQTSASRVGVFVNASAEGVIQTVKENHLDMVQLHGDESPDFCARIRENDIPLIKVFRVDEGFDFGQVSDYREVSDYYLFDTRTKLYGGSGKRFNWSVLEKYDQSKPFFLSGGLDLQSLDDLGSLKDMNLHALDFNSGVEKSPGLKDGELIEKIIDKLKTVNYEVFGG